MAATGLLRVSGMCVLALVERYTLSDRVEKHKKADPGIDALYNSWVFVSLDMPPATAANEPNDCFVIIFLQRIHPFSQTRGERIEDSQKTKPQGRRYAPQYGAGAGLNMVSFVSKRHSKFYDTHVGSPSQIHPMFMCRVGWYAILHRRQK